MIRKSIFLSVIIGFNSWLYAVDDNVTNLDALLAAQLELEQHILDQEAQLLKQNDKLKDIEADGKILVEVAADFKDETHKVKNSVQSKNLVADAFVVIALVGGGYLVWKLKKRVSQKETPFVAPDSL